LMQRSPIYLAAALGLALAGSVQAQDLVGGITNQLRDLGFEQIDVKQTLLGRTRIIARSAEGQREIILNPNTGEILRDFWQAAPGKSSTSRLVDNRNSAGSSGGDDGNGRDDSGAAGSDGGGDDSGSGNRNDNQSGSDDRGGNSGSDDDGSDDNGSDDSDSDDDDSDDSDSDDSSDDSDDSRDDSDDSSGGSGNSGSGSGDSDDD